MKKRDRENLNPHAEATAAMYVYSNEYGAQNGGSIDFWESLPERRKDFCRELVRKVKERTNERH